MLMTNGEVTHFVKPEDVDTFIAAGWVEAQPAVVEKAEETKPVETKATSKRKSK